MAKSRTNVVEAPVMEQKKTKQKETKPMSIRIIQTPDGSHPADIRKDWIGIEIPLMMLPSSVECQVSIAEAIKALKNANKLEAAAYWEKFTDKTNKLVFKRCFCRIIN